jgi:hypothetical protein
MVRRILLELVLFLLPFAVFLIYRAASKDLLIRDRWPLAWLVGIGAALAAGALVIAPLLTPSDGGKCFEAARYEDGKTIPAKRVDCEVVSVPVKETNSDAQPAPVAPRNEQRR